MDQDAFHLGHYLVMLRNVLGHAETDERFDADRGGINLVQGSPLSRPVSTLRDRFGDILGRPPSEPPASISSGASSSLVSRGMSGQGGSQAVDGQGKRRRDETQASALPIHSHLPQAGRPPGLLLGGSPLQLSCSRRRCPPLPSLSRPTPFLLLPPRTPRSAPRSLPLAPARPGLSGRSISFDWRF